jgi:hypothetical protein
MELREMFGEKSNASKLKRGGAAGQCELRLRSP